MDNVLLPKVHVTIRKGTSLPPLEKCSICCFPGMYHCPFCSTSVYKPAKRSKLMCHLKVHLRRACHIGEYVVYRCGLGCRRKLHFHCLYCPATVMRRRDFIIHVPFCQEIQQRKRMFPQQHRGVASETTGPTPGELINPTYYVDNSNDSESDEIATIPDFQVVYSQEASSSSSVTHFVFRSSNCDTAERMGKTAQPDTSKCHQMVQTNNEKPRDCDEHYFMNLVKVFKRLTPKKKAEVRMKMERILFEAELE